MASKKHAEDPKAGKGKSLTRLRVAIAVAFVLLGAVLLFLVIDKRPVMAVPIMQEGAYRDALAKAKAAPGFQEFRLITYEGLTPGDQVYKDADFVVAPVGPELRRQADAGMIGPVSVPDGPLIVLPASLLKCIPFNGVSPESGRALGYPIGYDPVVAFWRTDWIGGRDAVPPARWEELFSGGAKPVRRGMVALPGNDPAFKSAWLGYFSLFRLRDPTAAGSPPSWNLAAGEFEAASATRLFQQGAFSYGWDDALALLLKGNCAVMFAPLSEYYRLDMATRALIKISPLPLSAQATQASTIARVFVMAKSAGRGISFFNADSCARSLLELVFQEGAATANNILPCNIAGSFRDESARSARERARSSAYWYVLGDMAPPPDSIARFDSALKAASMLKK